MEFQPKAFDVETVFTMAKKRRTKKFRGPDSPLYTAVCPVAYIMRFFGLAPYKFSNDRLVPSNVYLIFSFMVLLFYSYAVCTECYRFSKLQRDTELLKGTEYVKIIFNYCMTVYDILTVAMTRKKFTCIWNSIQDYDEAVRILGYPQKETKTRIVCWCLLIYNTILWIAINQTGMDAFTESWSDNIIYMSVYIGSSMAVYKFVGITLLLGQRFHHLNEMSQKSVPSKIHYYRSIKIDLKTIQGLHNELMIIGESLNSLYTSSLILWLTNLSIHSVTNLYFIIGRFLSFWDDIKWPVIICLLLWLLMFTTQLLLIHVACDFTSTQANSIGGILIDWQVYLMGQNSSTMPLESTLHLLNRRLQFSAAGCFYVNLPLMRSIAALLTTYLVILLQLQ
ncbi:hypothetical protein KPH14_007051 [Odynerus spinipes]|uniref:Gustatory receptor n=1 Tax=Odynerus spinipes TaxID=1348599 RepID=A0AAD9VRV4_9HYME|nr:hypothetical protein KPH14_007051 [Odynerus spinipes]